MTEGGSLITLTYEGATGRDHAFVQTVMGVAGRALEASVRYLAADLGPAGRAGECDLRYGAMARTGGCRVVSSARPTSTACRAKASPLRRNVELTTSAAPRSTIDRIPGAAGVRPARGALRRRRIPCHRPCRPEPAPPCRARQRRTAKNGGLPAAVLDLDDVTKLLGCPEPKGGCGLFEGVSSLLVAVRPALTLEADFAAIVGRPGPS